MHKKNIHSFVRRSGRMTLSQKQALLRGLPENEIAISESIVNFSDYFKQTAPLILEIGFGNGHTLLTLAKENPEFNFVGMEVHLPGVGALLLRLKKEGLSNVRVIVYDAVIALEKMIPDAAFSQIFILFPDPWPKRRHHKRRLIQPEFVALIAKKLKRGGILHLATDWKPYAEQMMAVVQQDPHFKNKAGDYTYAPRPQTRTLTKFEKRGQNLGHGVYDLIFEKI